MLNVVDFYYGIITPYGYYFLHITNPDAFWNFANHYDLNATRENLRREMDDKIGLRGNSEYFTSKFIQFLNEKNSGLSVIMGKFMDESDNLPLEWQLKGAGNNDTLTNKDCD
jgi:hypothetical protein